MTVMQDSRNNARCGAVRHDVSVFSDTDIHLFKEGSHFRLYDKLGSRIIDAQGERGTYFSVWAPNARNISVIGDFNGWSAGRHPLAVRWDGSGIWEGFIPGMEAGALYKYHIESHHNGYQADKGDPYAFSWELAPRTATRVWDLAYEWQDREWMGSRHEHNRLDRPFSVYELHLGSWRRVPEEGNRFLTYRELAPQLAAYVREMGYTHVEFMPVMEHPFYGSWGYQVVGFFAPTSRYGTPQDFMYLIDYLHRQGIGVILDWVPSHFPADQHGIIYFDGTHLYEHSDPKKGFHPEWKSYIFNYGRNEVKNFLISNAMFWLDKYHVDGLRIDAVASMLYLDYARPAGEWIPNDQGGHENWEAVDFLKRLNEEVYRSFPDVQTIAEESTAWTKVSRPVYDGGLGFGMKWNMGWMHDYLLYMSKDPVFRKHHHNDLTFSLWYAFTENFLLSLSHDEVVYGKGSLLGKMPGDEWQKFANLRLLFGFMFAHPGKKLHFMGAEFGQWSEWHHENSLDWHLAGFARHHMLQVWMQDLNRFYRSEPSLYERDFDNSGFEWIDTGDWEQSIVSFVRKDAAGRARLLVVCNFTPEVRRNYRVGTPYAGYWREALNSDSSRYGGSNQGNFGGCDTVPVAFHGRPFSVSLTLPPLSLIAFRAPE